MSPSESDLRAALRDGEGDDRPDVDGLLTLVRGRRGQRRTRVLSAAAAVVVVVAAAVGGAALWGGSGGDGPRAGRTPGVSAAPSGVVTDRPTSGATEGARLAENRCPSVYPARSAPGGVVAPSDSTGRMFSEPVSAVVVCSYTDGGASGTAVAFTGAAATSLATSIETASTARLKIVCPDIASADKMQLAIIGVTAGGTQLPVVTTDVSVPNCNRPITNGTAVRYAWKPPADLAPRIAGLTGRGSAGAGAGTAPGTITGPTSGAGSGLPSVRTSSGTVGTPVR